MTKLNIRDHYGGYQTVRDPDGGASILGRGKFGVTIRASRPDLGEQYAIKILHDDVASTSSGKSRFVREIRALRYLEHDNLVKYLGADTIGDGEMYLIMELCDGGSLSDFVANHGNISERTVARIALQVVRGLRETHAKGFLHRDLKPSNLLLSRKLISKTELDVALNEEPALVKVADFGLVGHLTHDGKVKRGRFGGTVLFASPEQFQERSLDIRSDFYSLGMSMWYLACGGNPFKVDGSKIDFKEASRRHTDETPHVESTAMKSLGLSPEFVSLLGKLLAKDREGRLPDADAVEKSLKHFLRQTSRSYTDSPENEMDTTVSDDWGRGSLTDFYRIDRDLGDFRNRAVTLKAQEVESEEEFMLTVWKAEDDAMSPAERSLGRYLSALSRFSRREEVGSSLIPIRSVRRAKEEWCVAEPVIRGIPLSSYFEEDRTADPEEIIEVLSPIAETIDDMAVAGFNRGCISSGSVFIVPDEESDDYFVQGRWCDEPMEKWPGWKVLFSGISSPPQVDADKISSDPSFVSSVETTSIKNSETNTEILESLLTNTELLPTVSLSDGDMDDDSTLLELKGTGGFDTIQISSGSKTGGGVISKERVDSAGELSLFRNFCILVFRLFAGREVATAARWAPGAYVPTQNLSEASNRLLREHIAGTGGIESASQLFARIVEMEGLDDEFENRSTAILEDEPINTAVDTTRYPKRDPEKPQESKAADFRLIDFAKLGALLLIVGLMIGAVVYFRPGPAVPEIATTSIRETTPVVEVEKTPPPVEKITEPEDVFVAIRNPEMPAAEKIDLLKEAAEQSESQGQRERARATWLRMADILGEDENPSARADYLAKADEISPLGVGQWTYIYENSDSQTTVDKYRRRVISHLAGTEPEEAFTRLMELAEQTDDIEKKINYWSRSTSLPNISKSKLRTAYENIAENGGFTEKVNLYDFLRASSTYQQDAVEIGRQIVFEENEGDLQGRMKIARELWDRYELVEALKFAADQLPDGTEKQKYRWEYYNETRDPDYADAAKLLAASSKLSPRDQGRFAWKYFESLPLKDRDSQEAKTILTQAIEARINEAIVYHERSRQIEESKKAAEIAKQAAIEAMAAANRIDTGLKEIAARKIEKDGMLDEKAYREKMKQLTALLAEAEEAKKSAKIELQKSSIHWRKFITWEEATGLRARQNPYTGRTSVTKEVDPGAFTDLETAAKLGNQDAKARLASILAGANPVKPPTTDIEKAAQLASEVYQSDGVGRTEARLVLRHLLKGDKDVQRKTYRVLQSMNIDSSSVMN